MPDPGPRRGPFQPTGTPPAPPPSALRRGRPGPGAWLLALLLVGGLTGASAAEGPLVLEATPLRSTDGVLKLSWSAGGPVHVEESRRADFADFRVVYSGRDRATTLTGRADGLYHYRLRRIASAASPETRAGPAALSPPVRVEVAHHSLGRAMVFFGIGCVVFLSTVALIVQGDRRITRESRDAAG